MIKNKIKKILDNSVIKFIIIGGLAAGAELLSFIAINNLLPSIYLFAQPISFLTGLLFSFFGNKLWSFNQKGLSYSNKNSRQAIYYALLAVFNLLLTSILIAVAINIDINPLYVKLILMIAVATWNYFILNIFIFKVESAKSE